MNLFLRRLIAHSVMGSFVFIMLGTSVVSLGSVNLMILMGVNFSRIITIASIESYTGTFIGFSWLIYHMTMDLRQQRRG